jgi:hypothetical protein
LAGPQADKPQTMAKVARRHEGDEKGAGMVNPGKVRKNLGAPQPPKAACEEHHAARKG